MLIAGELPAQVIRLVVLGGTEGGGDQQHSSVGRAAVGEVCLAFPVQFGGRGGQGGEVAGCSDRSLVR